MELRRVAPVVGLVALLAADLVLIGWAFRPAPADGYVAAATPTATSAGTSTQRSSASPRPSAKATPPKPVPLEQFISAVGPTVAWVVRGGSCANPHAVWVTDDEGDTWRQNGAPGRVMRLLPDSATQAQAVGGDKTCDM